MASIDQLASVLNGLRWSESGLTARCPAHKDKTPSLSITERDGRVLVHCHAGCSQDAVLDALEARGVSLRHHDEGVPDSYSTLGRASAWWDYYERDGRHIGRVLRWDTTKGKEIRPASFDGSRWNFKAMPEPRPLYRLCEILRRTDDMVLVTEGEKAADAAQKLFPQHVATTWPGGAKAVRKADWRPLAGRNVILWPDADEPGRQAMDAVSIILRGLGCTVSRVNVAAFGTVPAGWDAADCTAEQAEKIEIIADNPVAIRRPPVVTAHEVDEHLLDDVRDFIRKFCAFPDEHALHAVALWAAHAHMVEWFHTTPRLALLSPEAGSGKTRVLEVLDLLVPDSLLTLNASPASIFRLLAQKRITLLFDEVDAIWSKRGQDDTHEDLRALLNSGYKRGATIPRCVGPKHDVVQFEVFCAVALAGLGDLPDTIMSRSIIIRMRRRAPHEQVEPFRTRLHEPPGHAIRDRLAAWAAIVGPACGGAFPELPPGIVDRPAEVWEPLIAVADAAGGHWPDTARRAAVELCKVAEDRRASLGVRLLADLRTIFKDAIALHVATIIERLAHGDQHGLDDDAPWADLHGQPIGKRGLASMLSRYGIKPQKVTVGGVSLQGYRREHLHDAWTRYLPPLSPTTGHPELSELAELPRENSARPIPGIPEIPQVRIGERASGDQWEAF